MSTFDIHDTFNKMATIIADQLRVDRATIKPESTFKDLGADSLDMVQIIMKLEEQFGIEINDADAEKMEKLADAVNYVNARRTK
ncbi:MAG: acyl carrier protein [Candidatus Babeliales bacterium]